MRLADAFSLSESNSMLLAATPSFSSLSSSDFDTESSSISFFPERSTTLGSLIGLGGVADPRSLNSAHLRTRQGRRLRAAQSATEPKTNLWKLIRCGICRDYYMDDGIAPPSLAQFLEVEREAEKSRNQSKVYINIMYEEGCGYAPDAMNPLFDSTISNVTHSAHRDLPVIEEERPYMGPCGDSPKQLTHNGRLPRSNVDVQVATRKHRRAYSDNVCNLNCVSNIWGMPKSTGCKAGGGQSQRKLCSNAKKSSSSTNSSFSEHSAEGSEG